MLRLEIGRLWVVRIETRNKVEGNGLDRGQRQRLRSTIFSGILEKGPHLMKEENPQYKRTMGEEYRGQHKPSGERAPSPRYSRKRHKD